MSWCDLRIYKLITIFFFYDDVINIMLIMTGRLEIQHENLCSSNVNEIYNGASRILARVVLDVQGSANQE